MAWGDSHQDRRAVLLRRATQREELLKMLKGATGNPAPPRALRQPPLQQGRDARLAEFCAEIPQSALCKP